MLLITLSWIYITFTCVNIGVFVDKILGLNTRDFTIIIISGLFGVTIFTGFWAVFIRVNWEFHTVLIVLNFMISIFQRKKIATHYKQFQDDLKSLTTSLKILLSIIIILIISQCSSSPYIFDNETYYTQSVKWLNEFGFVKGLANLHPFLAQMSGWHVVQSAFSFSFMYDGFNDISGFMLLIGNFFAISKLNAYFQNNNKLHLAAGLLPVANIFLFQFISAPSPDLPIYILSIIIVFYFIENYDSPSVALFKLVSILAVFCFYIKPTSVFLMIFPVIYFIGHYSFLRKNMISVITTGVLVLSAFVIKNTIISGYPLFPFTGIAVQADYLLPEKIAHLYLEKHNAFHISKTEYMATGAWHLFIKWLSLPGLHGLFNKTALILVVIAPMLIYRFYNKKPVWAVYLVMCLQFVCLYVSSPQYRFFFNFILIFGLLFTSIILTRKNQIYVIVFAATAITLLPVFLPVNLSFFTKNKLMDKNNSFSVSNIIFPAANSKIECVYVDIQEGNLNYHSHEDIPNFWITGNAPLPAVSTDQLEYFRKKYGYVPQLRGESLKDGFYPKRVAE